MNVPRSDADRTKAGVRFFQVVVRALLGLTDHRLARYYGDIAGTGLDHVAFAWTFTTAPVVAGLASNGRDVYYLSHPSTHGCLATGVCE